MTTIIFDGKNKKLYTDTQISNVDVDGKIIGTFTGAKIWKKNGNTCAGTGSVVVIDLMRDLLHEMSLKFLGWTFFCFIDNDNGNSFSNADDSLSHVIVIRKSKPKVYEFHSKIKRLQLFRKPFSVMSIKAKLLPINHKLPRIFMGSGQDYACDYMKKGHDPVTAIKMTSEHDSFTNDLVHEVEV
jgi:hypothetical protein